ncbi:MAG TPA: aspartate kinase [Atribacteraceae bacterium]|nr:aspartate kinase [Atribacteraceae bacterium]
MSFIVQKYGGSSVADIEKIRFVASKIKKYHWKGHQLVVVVSAMGKTTDQLLRMAASVHPRPPERELDMLLATGEQISVSLLSIALEALGVRSISLTGGQAGIITSEFYTKAKILRIHNDRIMSYLRERQVVIVAGFQGKTSNGDITTLGRGGSDTTACALAAALGADICEIFTDVNGVYTADPRIVPAARRINRISYDEMAEMASLGAKVLQLRAVDFSRKYGVRVHVRSTFSDEEGTWIKEGETVEEVKVRAITHTQDLVKIVLLGVPNIPGVAARIFKGLADQSVTVDMIIQSEGREDQNQKDFAFVISREDETKVRNVLENLGDDLPFQGIKFDDTMTRVSIVGAGIVSDPSIAFRMFRVLGEREINIDMISTSNLRISCLITRDKMEEAIEALHREFIGDEEVTLNEGI